MAITRRQFVTRLGALAAAAGFSQADVSKLATAFGNNSNDVYGGDGAKPKVIWIHGAECTGCSTSLLGILENPGGKPFKYDTDASIKGITTLGALQAAGMTPTAELVAGAPLTLWGDTRDALYPEGELVNIADVVIDVIDLQYHETVMGMGGDLAAKWLHDLVENGSDENFVLVVEGALQRSTNTGAWGDDHTEVPWCSIGVFDDGSNELDMPEVVAGLAAMTECAAIIPIGQCACFGGYPGCKPQISAAAADLANDGFDPAQSQTGALGTYEFLDTFTDNVPAVQDDVRAAKAKVYNAPGCPTNPWWFVLTTVLVMLKLAGTDLTARDSSQRIKKVYPGTVHGPFCPRFGSYNRGEYAKKPGDPGCLLKIGCKGMTAASLCGKHGWNNQQPQNPGSLSSLNTSGVGGHCTVAGHPCMACTEKGYPDSFVPFVAR